MPDTSTLDEKLTQFWCVETDDDACPLSILKVLRAAHALGASTRAEGVASDEMAREFYAKTLEQMGHEREADTIRKGLWTGNVVIGAIASVKAALSLHAPPTQKDGE